MPSLSDVVIIFFISWNIFVSNFLKKTLFSFPLFLGCGLNMFFSESNSVKESSYERNIRSRSKETETNIQKELSVVVFHVATF